MKDDFLVSDWLVQPSLGRMSRGETTIALRAKVMDLLVFLAARPGEVLSKDALLDGVWGTEAISESALTKTITELRQAFDDPVVQPRVIETIPKRGYRLIAPVSLPTAPTAPVPATAEVVRSVFSRTRTWGIALAGLLVIATVLALGIPSITREAGPADGPEPSRVDPAFRTVVLPFSYRGGRDNEYLAEAMVDLLGPLLHGAGPLTMVEPRAVLSQPGVLSADQPTASALAKKLGAGRYVLGDIVEAGQRLRITARLYRTESDADPVRATVDGRPEDLLALVADLTGQLAVGAGVIGRPTLQAEARGTTSLEALKAFLRGERLIRTSRDASFSAYPEYERAVQLDPQFAFGWYRLSQWAYLAGTAHERVAEFAETAARHSSGLHWRDRKLIEANAAVAGGAIAQAERIYQEILRVYENDADALFDLTGIFDEYSWLRGGPPNDHRSLLEALLRYDPDQPVALESLRNVSLRARDCAEATELHRRLYPDDPPAPNALLVFCGTNRSEQERLLTEAREWPLDELRLMRLRLNVIGENPRAAKAFAEILADRETLTPPKAINRLFLAEYQLALGRRQAARGEFQQLAGVYPAWALTDEVYRLLAPQFNVAANELRAWRQRLSGWEADEEPAVDGSLRFERHNSVHAHIRAFLLGRIAARLDEHETALRFADELLKMPTSQSAGSLSEDLALSIRAHVFARQGRPQDALRALEAAPREVPFHHREFSWVFTQPQERFLRAQLLEQLGRHADALWWYQSVHYHPDSVSAGPSHFRQAQIYERLGKSPEAIAQYQRLIDLWRDADPEFQPTVTAARQALQRLGATPRAPSGPIDR